MKKNITIPGGLHTDNSPIDQPENTTIFNLNVVNENDEGNSNRLSNENSNEECYQLTDGYAYLGDVYIGNNELLIFSVAEDESSSEIGIVDRECTYTALINHDFGFKLQHQIDATYRLRRGCERTIYWTDPKPRIINIDGLEDYKDDLGNYVTDSFNLFKTYSKIPVFSSIEIGEDGAITAGSVNFAIQYLDEDFNPTEFITSSDVVKIYNDNLSRDFSDIRGSTNRESDYQRFGITNKSVIITLSNLDINYPFYRIAIIKSDGGTGLITGVEYSHEIPTELPTYRYTGQGVTVGTVEEIQEMKLIVDSAEHIEQLEGKLILSNTKGKQVNYCNLQSYASRIKTDLVFKKIILNEISESNPKSPTASIDGTGYMPGEIYSFGIVWVFDDGSTTPVYHIPGKAEGYSSEMSLDNTVEGVSYTDNASCEDYWGVDSEGNKLKNQPVRHHRFPLRSDVDKPLFQQETIEQNTITSEYVVTVESRSYVYEDDRDFYALDFEYTTDGQAHSYSRDIYNADLERGAIDFFTLPNSNETTVITEIRENGVVNTGTNGRLMYSHRVEEKTTTRKSNAYTAEIFGLDFSNINKPSLTDTGGNEILGYYIVRNERGEENKTILDSAVVMPLMEQEYFVAYGHTVPKNVTNIKQDAFALIHPEHKFLNKEYKNTTEIIQEGEYIMVGSQANSAVRTQDVMVGTSYDPEVAKRKENDADGFTLHSLTRDTEVSYRAKKKMFIPAGEIDEVFYLNGLSSKTITDTDDIRKEIFNVSADNKIAVVSSTEKKDYTSGILPYVVLKRNLASPYSNFRYMPYYKQGKNINHFVEGEPSTTTIFGGDAYIGSMRYFNSFYYDIRLRRRKTKSGLFNIILGGLAVIAGALITIGTLGGGAALGIAVAGFGISQIATGINKEQIGKVYNELYEQGLRKCIKDDDTEKTFNHDDVPDDEIQWMGEAVTNLWFESSVNIGLRQGMTMNLPDFLASPAIKARKGVWGDNRAADSATNELDTYLLEKLTILDADAANGRLYQGFANAEFYELNLDYLRENHEKIYNHLGIEYDCCSDCNEVFPQRTHHSETSFQEELTDNYRIFLPNNYRDLEGEKGVITNVYKIQNNLYLHTEEALWHLPQNFQERVTGDILSFLGTGEFFNIPPRKIVDADQSSAGTRHKWGTIKTKHGILFPSIDDLKWYLFTGNDLQPISDEGNFTWFKKNMPFRLDEQYYKANKRPYPYNDNPASKFGIGFLSTYDSAKERFIITKKDYSLNPVMLQNNDYEICENNGQLVIFNNYSQIIQGYKNQGFKYIGMDKCQMKFTKTIYDTVTETRLIKSKIANSADVHYFLDTSGSFGRADGPDLDSIRQAVQNWVTQFRQENPDWVGNIYEYLDSTERWLNYAKTIANTTYRGENLAGKDIIVVSFCNEAQTVYNDAMKAVIPAPTSHYLNDYNTFKQLHAQYNSFIGIHYPIVFPGVFFSSQSRGLVQQSLAALKGVSYTAAEASAIEYNEAFTDAEWKTLTDSLQGNNPYPDDGLENYGWVGKWNRNNIGGIIDSATFANDINGLLASKITFTETEVQVKIPRTIENLVPGEPINSEDFLQSNNSWTMSYSLKRKQWVSWHSYFPNFYLQLPNNFYAGIYGDGKIWRFNRKGHYQTFFGVYYPHIIEYVASSNPMETTIIDSLMIQTDASQYQPESENYVDKRFITFNKLLIHNSRQLSGVLSMVVKDTNAQLENYFEQQISNTVGEIIIDKNEQDWYINGFRDMRVDYDKPMFRKDLISLQSEYFTDKVVNEGVVDMNKEWNEMESFRDKYLVVRLIFDNFDSVKLVTNFSLEDETPSER